MEAIARHPARADQPMLLVVGDLQDWERRGRQLPDGPGLRFIDFSKLDLECLDNVRPDVVISGLFAAGFDALDIAATLERAGYLGRYRVIADRIPKPGLVRTEVRHVAPNVDFDVINLLGELANLV